MKKITPVVAAASALLLLAGCADSPTGGNAGGSDPMKTVDEVDITQLCGDDEIKIALTDGAGGSTWRKTVLAEFKDEASKCDNITEVLYADAGDDPQKAAADISGFVSQGVDIIVTLPDHGDAMIPAMREAVEAGVTVIDYYNLVNGEAGVDFTDAIYVDSKAQGADMAEWVAANADPGNVIVIGGVASSPSAKAIFEGAQEALEGNSDFTLIGDGFVSTDYNPESAERAVGGLINQYGNITGVISEYGVISDAALNAFAGAGEPYPTLANSSGQNSIYCYWWDAKDAGKEYALGSWEASTQVVRRALRFGLAHHNNIEYTAEDRAVIFDQLVDTPAGVQPPACEASLPDDADRFTGLTEEQLEKALS